MLPLIGLSYLSMHAHLFQEGIVRNTSFHVRKKGMRKGRLRKEETEEENGLQQIIGISEFLQLIECPLFARQCWALDLHYYITSLQGPCGVMLLSHLAVEETEAQRGEKPYNTPQLDSPPKLWS